MPSFAPFWNQTDAIGRTVALLLLLMSVGSWVTILWKAWVLHRARRDIARAVPVFWAAGSQGEARDRLQPMDRERLLLPLLEAAASRPQTATLAAGTGFEAHLTRRLRDALHRGLAHLQLGQVLLASVGATAPFVGLFGTVWGIYHALGSMAASGSITIDRVAGPVGEALVMTAAGLAVAIPAVLAYNLFGKWVAACEAELEGFAHDLRAMALRDDAAGGR